jgi:hypothetical protein
MLDGAGCRHCGLLRRGVSLIAAFRPGLLLTALIVTACTSSPQYRTSSYVACAAGGAIFFATSTSARPGTRKPCSIPSEHSSRD